MQPPPGHPMYHEWMLSNTDLLHPIETVESGASSAQLASLPLPFSLEYEFSGRRHGVDHLIAETHTTALAILHRGMLVYESYPGRYASPATRLRMYSITKSITSLLVGIAIDKGIIGSVDQSVIEYLPEFAETSFADASLFDLLNMSSGSRFQEEFDNPLSEIYRWRRSAQEGDPRQMAKTLLKDAPAGTTFGYSSIDSAVLGWVLEHASGMSLAAFNSEHLWQPIGAEHDAYYYLSQRTPQRHLAGSSFNATARDMLRVGELVRNGGLAGETRVVSPEWVARFFVPERRFLRPGQLGPGLEEYGYSYKWWSLERSESAIAALGIHGQYLYVDTAHDVVIMRASASPSPENTANDEHTEIAFAQFSALIHDQLGRT